MPPIDPLQLLTALSPLLGSDGGIKSQSEVIKLASLMKKFSKKLVSRCVYVQILKATETTILQKFLEDGGWEIINTWLKEGKDKEDNGFLHELLELYMRLPMTVEKLKENNSAKIIKALSKVESESVKKIAQDIISAWMKLVKRERNDSSGEKSKKKKKHADKVETKGKINPVVEDVSDKDGSLKAPSNQVVPTKKGSVKIKKVAAEKKPDKLTQNLKRLNTDDLEDAKPMVIPVEKPVKKVKKVDRPSTVKTYRASFRATGLEDALPVPPVGKKVKLNEKQLPILTIKRSSDYDLGPITPPEKKIKPASLITPADAYKNEDSLFIKAPAASKPKPAHHVIQESAGFMDALVAVPVQLVRKKKKPLAKSNAEATSPTTPNSASPTKIENKPQFQFYKDTLESPKDKVPPEVEEVKLTGEGERTPSPVQDKEEQNKEEQNKENKNIEFELESSDNGTSNGKKISNLKSESSKKKKSVTWAEEPSLKEVFFFILDETERVNVNTLKNFGDLKSKDLQMEKQTMMNARQHKGDYMEEQISWRMPVLMSGAPTFEPGANSTEREAQHLRQQGVLQYLFLSKESAMDTPLEPDLDKNTINTNTKIIPLEDETNQNSVNDYSNMSFITPNPVNQDIPSALNNLMISMANSNQVLPQPNMLHMPNDGPIMQPIKPDQYFNGVNPGIIMPMNMPGNAPMGGPGMGPSFPDMRMMGPRNFQPRNPNMRPPWRGPRGPRGMGPRPRGGGRFIPYTPCRNFLEGSCQFADKCRFLHPGINGPPL